MLSVLYSVTIVGEAVKQLSPEFRAKNPLIPWKAIVSRISRILF